MLSRANNFLYYKFHYSKIVLAYYSEWAKTYSKIPAHYCGDWAGVRTIPSMPSCDPGPLKPKLTIPAHRAIVLLTKPRRLHRLLHLDSDPPGAGQ